MGDGGKALCGGCDMNAADKDDKNPCTSDWCDQSDPTNPKWRHTAYPVPPACDDGDPCTVNDVCKDTVCAAGTPKDCNDNDPCTDDSCNGQTGACTSVAKKVDDGNICTNDICNKSTGNIEHYDLSVEKLMEVCGNMDKTNPCMVPECDKAQNKCVLKGLSPGTLCNDGNACTENDNCLEENGKMKCGGNAVICTSPDVCMDGACDTTLGCQYSFNEKKCPECGDCDDGNPCTMDSCIKSDPTKPYCEHLDTANAGETILCNADSNVCTIGDMCQGEKCIAGLEMMNCNDGNECTADTCDPVMGCVHTEIKIEGICPPGDITPGTEDPPLEIISTAFPCQVDIGREVKISDGTTMKLVASPVEQEAAKITQWNDRIRKAVNAPVDLFVGENGGQMRAALNLPNIKTMVVSKGAYIARTFQMSGARPVDYTKFATRPVWTDNTLKQPLQIVPTDKTLNSVMSKYALKESDVNVALPAPNFNFDIIPSESVTETSPSSYEIPNVLRVTFGVSPQAAKNAKAIGSAAAVVDPLNVEIVDKAPVMNCTWKNDSCPDIGPSFDERFPMVDDPSGSGQKIPKVLAEIERRSKEISDAGGMPSPAIIYDIIKGGKAVWDTIGYTQIEYTLLPDIMASAAAAAKSANANELEKKISDVAKNYNDQMIKAASAEEKAEITGATYEQLYGLGICPAVVKLVKPLEMDTGGSGCSCHVGAGGGFAGSAAEFVMMLIGLLGLGGWRSWLKK